MKKIISFVIVILLIAIFFILNKKENTPTNTISFSSWGSQSETIIMKELIREYEQRSGTKINFVHIPQNYFQKIQLLFASGLEPDVVFFNNQNIQMYIKAGLLEDLSKYTDENTFYSEALNCFKYKNGIYAIPRDISTLVLYYNKDIFDSRKIDIQKEIIDLKSLTNTLEKIKNDKYFGINFEEDTLFWSYYLASNGGGIISDDKKEIIITKKESIEALKLYSDMINKKHIMPTKAEIGSKTTAQMFINQELALYLGGRWMVPKFRELIDFNWDIMEFPVSKNKKVYADASGWAISKKSKNKERAIDFIKFLSSEKSLNKLAKTGLIIPANIKAAEWTIKEDKNKSPQSSEVFISMIKNTKCTPVNENYASINDIIKDKSAMIFIGKENPEDVFDERTIEKLESLIK